MGIMIVILIILLIFLFSVWRKNQKIVSDTDKIKEENQKQKREKAKLEQELFEITNNIHNKKNEYDSLKIINTSLLSQNDQLEKDYGLKKELLKTTEDSIDKAHKERMALLDNEYNVKLQKEQEKHELVLTEYYDEIEKIKQELITMKSTRDSAMEAWRKEEEIKANQDYYRLDVSFNDKNDILLLENIKPKFSNPRVISKLIWQTYYQPLAKTKFNMILGETATGIYKITNTKNNMCYIGQATDLYKRWCEHCKCGCGIDTPSGNKLYKSMMEDGLSNFTFEIIESCDREVLNEKESYYIDLYSAVDYGYNSIRGTNG